MHDPLELALASAARISPAGAAQLLRGEAVPLPTNVAPWLLAHQRAAAGRLRALLARWGGAVLADATGLGKTYVALAVARAEPGQLTVVAPAVLRQQWLDAARRTAVAAEIVSTESLSRGHELPADAKLAVIDEAHHFRNPGTKRYGRLARWLVGRRALLLTATPIVNRVADLVALLRLFLPDDALRSAGVPSLGLLDRRPALVPTVWQQVAVARDAAEARVEDRLPRRRVAPPLSVAPVAPASLDAMLALIDELETPGTDEPRALLKLLLLRSLASSAAAGRASVQHHARFVERALGAASEGCVLPRKAFRELIVGADPNQLWLLPLHLDRADDGTDVAALERDRKRLIRISELAAPGEDPKAAALQTVLDSRPLTDKAVIFVSAIATARYLARKVPRAVALTGCGGWTPAGSLPGSDALRPFAPSARVPPHLDARVLVATDVAGEGLDLHGASLVVHYDLPWTPARLAQRFGRVRRLGSLHSTVDERAFVPPPSLASRLRTVARLLAKERIGRAANRVVASPSLVLQPQRSVARRRSAAPAPAVVYRLHAGGYWSVGSVPRGLSSRATLRQLRTRLRAADANVAPTASVLAARRTVLKAAGRAARERAAPLLRRAELALERLSLGLSAGELLRLDDALEPRPGRLGRILEWAEAMGSRRDGALSIELFVVIDPPGD